MLIDAPLLPHPPSGQDPRIVGAMNDTTPNPHDDIRPLTDEEQGWIDQNWEVSSESGMAGDTDSLTRGYQLARGNWELAPEDERPRAEHAVVGFGALVGQYICNYTDFEWGVRGEGPEAAWVIVNPDGQIIEPMKQVAAIWTGQSKQTLGGFVAKVLEGYSGER